MYYYIQIKFGKKTECHFRNHSFLIILVNNIPMTKNEMRNINLRKRQSFGCWFPY